MKETKWSTSGIAVPDPAIVVGVPWSAGNIGRSDKVISVASVEQRGPVAILVINRPEKLNAINKQVAARDDEALRDQTHLAEGPFRAGGSLQRRTPGRA
jgi:phosphoribosylcarboxyaminoimidazole (NCAIR) mutase